MSMSRRSIQVIGVSVLIGLILWLLSHRRNTTDSRRLAQELPRFSDHEINPGDVVPAPIQKSQTNVASVSEPNSETTSAAWLAKRLRQTEDAREQAKNEWRTPIEFYGRVVDENTNPVANADIHFVWTDLSPQGTTEKGTLSDENGRFSLVNVSGKHLIAKVSKQGYYPYQPFGIPFSYAGENQNFVPDAANPVIFRLKKKGVAERLIHLHAAMGGGKGFRIPRDGTPLEISLTTGKAVPVGQGDLRVECWTDDTGKRSGQKYNWKCRITVPNGSILQSPNELDFEAALTGYQPEDEIDMPANREADWGDSAKRRYFLKLADGNYARMSFETIAGGDHFFEIESFLNPSGGCYEIQNVYH
jgi:hypothetical protein